MSRHETMEPVTGRRCSSKLDRRSSAVMDFISKAMGLNCRPSLSYDWLKGDYWPTTARAQSSVGSGSVFLERDLRYDDHVEFAQFCIVLARKACLMFLCLIFAVGYADLVSESELQFHWFRYDTVTSHRIRFSSHDQYDITLLCRKPFDLYSCIHLRGITTMYAIILWSHTLILTRS